ncbi:RCC1 and BTB domain-containing protein 1-like [Mycetomoellerius zeteki]|uniref:RCC1 and BTB domain-containing protein 1-like n=1 Tax=Mycetomoellerius zeteki TaxID=64791 RepID=UPI00084E43CB|nr:PREDICTED: RCC1 and BTB domain-containing protein 1-like [Trachymyrmex zeteki]
MASDESENEGKEVLTRDKPGYQKWLAERSCSKYSHIERRGVVVYLLHPEKVDYMFGKIIKMLLIDCDLTYILLTENGEIYHWLSGIELAELNLMYYSHLIDLRYSRVVQSVAGGGSTFIILTDDQKVFYFQNHHFNDLAWLRQMHFQIKVDSICCGYSFFVVLTADNKIYTWGKNNCGQLGVSRSEDKFIDEPLEVKITEGVKIIKVACGYTHVLALSEEGNIFAWGGNSCGQLGCNRKNDLLTPEMVTAITPKPMKMLDIAAMKNMSCAISEEKLIYIWGSCFSKQIPNPITCEYMNLFDTCNALTARPRTTVKYFQPNERSTILHDIAKMFNDPNISDLVIKIGWQSIYVHKNILQFRNSYFKSIDQFISSENDQDIIRFDQFSYAMCYAYFKYLYTGKIDVSLEQRFDLLKLADELNDNRFEASCYKAIKEDIMDETVFSIYNTAQKYDSKTVEKFCFEYFQENKKNVMETHSFMELKEDIKNIFIALPNKSDERHRNL